MAICYLDEVQVELAIVVHEWIVGTPVKSQISFTDSLSLQVGLELPLNHSTDTFCFFE